MAKNEILEKHSFTSKILRHQTIKRQKLAISLTDFT